MPRRVLDVLPKRFGTYGLTLHPEKTRLVPFVRPRPRGYYGITGNAEALARFSYKLVLVWWKWLNRRSQRASMRWEVFLAMLKRTPLPPARAVHSTLRAAANP